MVSTLLNVITRGYSPQPTTLQKAGRYVLIALNMAAATAPLFTALSETSKYTRLELMGGDAAAHAITAFTLLISNTPTWPLCLANGYRVATLVSGLSTFPPPAQTGDAIFHAVNLISPFVL